MKKLSGYGLVRFSVLALVVLALAIVLPAQIQNGQFQGTVLDQSGAAVPNATVTATNSATGQTFTAHSSGSGFYTMNQLPVGTYNVKASAQGFKAAEAKNQAMNAGMIQALNFKLTVGEVTQTVEVTTAAPLVQTDDPRLSSTVGAQQIANLPLNGRNVYDLIQMNPGATNVRGVLTENGANTVVNGVREDFNGFTINGVSNKGLSGGAVNQPIADTVQEFQELTLNNSAQYGNSAGAQTNLVTKGGTNNYHGDIYEFFRNDALDANNFFINQTRCDGGVANGCPLHNNPELRFNQFGGTFGGPLIKDKLFFFAGYQGDRFIVGNTPSTQTIESQAFRQAVAQANPGTVAALLYSNFPPSQPVSGGTTITDYLGPNGPVQATGDVPFTSISDYLCPGTLAGAGIDPAYAATIAQRLANVFGVTAADQAACASGALPIQAGTFNRSLPFMQDITSTFLQQNQGTQGNLFNGNEGYLRLDWNAAQNDRVFASFNWLKTSDQFGPGLPDSVRGFTNPEKQIFPNFQFNYVHTFTPNVLNEFRAGYLGNIALINTNVPGVPLVGYDTLEVGFGSYNGYPQFFKENVYTYSDMVTWNHGSHNMKMGIDVRRNIENSEFNVARPSYYFFDPLFFVADAPYFEAAGVDPGIASGTNISQLQSNVRHWRNIEFGAYYQDDWKVTRKLTLNLGLRYDLYTRHNEENGLATQFTFGPGNNKAEQVFNANTPVTAPGCDTPLQIATAQIAGVCGPGGFSAAKSLGSGDHNNIGPRVGFAYDVFGNGKTSLRGGVGMSYEGTLYNPLSNSRWNLPYYSFNSAFSSELGVGAPPQTIVYGPCQTPATPCGVAPSFTGPPAPGNNEGTIGAQHVGNINGWFCQGVGNCNPNAATLTGIVPRNIRDPYVYNYYLGVQHEILPQTVLEVDYVGTTGHKLFRAQNINHIPGERLPFGTCVTDNLGRQLCGLNANAAAGGAGVADPLAAAYGNGAFLNPNYHTLREWENVNNSNYNAMQTSLRHQFAHGLQFAVNYTWSHSIDNGSTWHSGATSSNGSAAGEGYSLDLYLPGLDRGNSIYDVRHRLTANYVWELPFFKNSSNWLAKNVFGGWQTNGIWSFQTGAHWEPACISSSSTSSCDYNKNGIANDRPDVAANNVDASHDMWATGWGDQFVRNGPFFTDPCLACTGSEGRNTFVGPNYFDADLSLFKNFHITERASLQFRFETFNTLNRTNFELPGAVGATHNRITSSSFGQAGAAFSPRQLQFGLKLNF